MKIFNKLFPETQPKQRITVVPKEKETEFSVQEKKIQEIFDKSGEELTPEKMEEVQAFLSETEGTIDSKLETLQKSMDKDIEINKENLQTVHKALHQPLDISMEMEVPELPKMKLMAMLPKEMKVEIANLMDKGMSFEEAIKVVIETKLTEFIQPDMPEYTGEDIETKEVPQKEEVKVQPEVETKERPEKHETTAKETVTKEPMTDEPLKLLEEVFEQLGESLDEIAEIIQPHVEPAFFEASSVRKFIQTTMTEKMAETKKTFDMYQKGIDHQLKQIIESPKTVDVKEVLSQVIDKLDHIIMKSDVPLYTDMKTERDLLQSSGQLEVAREMLDKDTDKAFEIIKSVKDIVSKINYKPVKQKIFGVAQKVFIEKMYEEQLIKQVPLKLESGMKSSPRAVLETLRELGINHESEVSEHLNKKNKEMWAPANLKAILMKLEESADQRVQSKEVLDNLTGQQLLNKLEIKSHKQHMTFNIPVKVDSEIKNLKVHVNAKKDRQKIDWKNSRLYFVIHLEDLGDTGVLVDVNKGHVNVTIKNDHEDIEARMKPFVKEGLERLESVGFTASSIKFQKLSEEEEHVEEKKNFEVSL